MNNFTKIFESSINHRGSQFVKMPIPSMDEYDIPNLPPMDKFTKSAMESGYRVVFKDGKWLVVLP